MISAAKPTAGAAVPAVGFAAPIIYQGGWILAARIAPLRPVAVHELSNMLARARPVRLASMLAVLALVIAGTAGHERQVLLVLVASVPVSFWLSLVLVPRERVPPSLSVTFLTIVWIGLGVAHAAMLRGVDHGGALVFL